MAKDDFSRQEEQVNLILERIRKILKDKLSTTGIVKMVGKIIQMKEKGEADDALKKYISSVTGIENSNPMIEAILTEVTEKPSENNYFPFNNNLLEQMKKDLEKE